jgi:hypothetical protein
MSQEHRPGTIVPESGIYTVTHDEGHTQRHDVTCIAGEQFPPCRGCKHPRFVLKVAAQHVLKHPSFNPNR